MSSPHTLVEAAVRRDLHRARIVLASAAPLSAERRIALCDHLTWMAELVGSHDPVLGAGAVRLRAAAVSFRSHDERVRRSEVLGAVGALYRRTGCREQWIAGHLLPVVVEHHAWLLDGAAHPAREPALEADERADARARADAYWQRRRQMWGSALPESSPTGSHAERLGAEWGHGRR